MSIAQNDARALQLARIMRNGHHKGGFDFGPWEHGVENGAVVSYRPDADPASALRFEGGGVDVALRDSTTKGAADTLYARADDIEEPLVELTDSLSELTSGGESEDREQSTTIAREALIALVDAVANLAREAKKYDLIDFELIDSRGARAKEAR